MNISAGGKDQPCACVHSDTSGREDSLTPPGKSCCHGSVTRLRAKVLFVSYTTDVVGPTNSLLLLLRHLGCLYDVSVLLPGPGVFSEELTRNDIPFFTLPSMSKWSIPAIYRLIKKEHFDLVYGNNTSSCSRNTFIAAKLAGVPFICHVRGMGWRKSWLQLGFLKFADSTIAVSEACAKSISRFSSREKLHVVRNGVDISAPEADHNSARDYLLSQTGLQPQNVVVISVAHVCSRKGQEHAIRAIAETLEKAPSVHLLLVGSLDRDAAYVHKIRLMIKEKGLDQQVSIIGFRRDIPQLLRGSDVFIHTAMADPHPRSVIEAMEASLPVVAFSVDGVAESVVDGVTGYRVPKGDISEMSSAVLKLATDRSLRVQLGRNGRSHVEENFTAEATAQRIRNIIDGVLDSYEQRRKRHTVKF